MSKPLGTKLQEMIQAIGHAISDNHYESAVRKAAGDSAVLFFGRDINNLDDIKLSDNDMAQIDALLAGPEALDKLKKNDPHIFKDTYFEELKANDPDFPDKFFNWKESNIRERLIFIIKMQRAGKFLKDPSPFAIPITQDGETSCMVQKLNKDYDEKGEIVEIISGIPASRLKTIPGTDELWQATVGIHEGAHCVHLHEPTLFAYDILKHEIKADQETINWLRDRNLGEMAQTLVDYRILGTVFRDNISHTSNLFISEGREPKILLPEHVTALSEMKYKMIDAVLAESGMKRRDVWAALEFSEENKAPPFDPDFIARQNRIIDTLETLLEKGEFNDTQRYNPHMKALVETFVGAFNRQIEGRTPKPNMDYGRIGPAEDTLRTQGGTPVQSSDGTSVRVGGYSDLSGTFGQAVNPNALNRIKLETQQLHPRHSSHGSGSSSFIPKPQG